MSYKKLISLSLLILLISANCFADEVITDFNDEKSVPVLNEELRKLGKTNTDNTAAIAALTASLSSLSYLQHVKVGTFTRDLTTASGTQTVTGVGFTPSVLFCIGEVDGTVKVSWGMASATAAYGMTVRTSTGNYYGSFTLIWFQHNATPDQAYATLNSFNADGFVLDWIKDNSPTGTANIFYAAIG